MTERLHKLLAPLSADAFLARYQAREYFHVPRSSPDFYADLLRIVDIDDILQSRRLPVGVVQVVKNGERRPMEDWSRFISTGRGMQQIAVPESLLNFYAEGSTLILNQANAYIPPLTELCRELTQELGFPTQTNIYITPREAAGFCKHFDDHDVMILQVAGGKAWKIYAADDVPVEIDLRSGDLLYVPRGMPHAGTSHNEDSIHITLGLKPPYAFQLISDLAAIAAGRTDFQQPAPPRFAGAKAMQAFEAELLTGLGNLVAELKPGHLVARRAEEQKSYEGEAWPGRFADLRLLGQMTPGTVVGRRAEAPVTVQDEGRFTCIASGERQVTIPVFVNDQLPVILGEKDFAIGALQGMMTDTGKVKLIAEFVKAGILRIVTL